MSTSSLRTVGVSLTAVDNGSEKVIAQYVTQIENTDEAVKKLNDQLGDNYNVETKVNKTRREANAEVRKVTQQVIRQENTTKELVRQLQFEQRISKAVGEEKAALRAEYRLGSAATQEQINKVTELARENYKLMEANSASGGSMNNSRHIAQNFGWQLQDTVVQIQGGTDAMVVFAQQGSQMASAFGPAGAVYGAVIAIAGAIGGVLFASLRETNGEIDEIINKKYDEIFKSETVLEQIEAIDSKIAETEAEIEKLRKGTLVVEQVDFGAGYVLSEFFDSEAMDEAIKRLGAQNAVLREKKQELSDLLNTVYTADQLDSVHVISPEYIQAMNADNDRAREAHFAEQERIKELRRKMAAEAEKLAREQALSDDQEFYSEVERLRSEHENRLESLDMSVQALRFKGDPAAKALDDALNTNLMLSQALDARLVSQKEFETLSEASWDRYNQSLSTSSAATAQSQLILWSSVLSGMEGSIGQLAGLAEEGSSEAEALFYFTQAIAFANAIVSSHSAAAQALGDVSIPFTAAKISMSNAVLALGYANAGIIAGTTFAGAFDKGGLIPSGQAGVVSEFGNELIGGTLVYNQSGSPLSVTGREKTAELMSGRGSFNVTIHQVIQANGDKTIVAMVKQGAEQAIEAAYSRVDNDFATGRGIAKRVR